MNWKCGIDMGAAREKVRTAHTLASLGREAQQQIDWKLTWFHDQDGMLVINARLPAELGQMFIKAIEAACEELPTADDVCAFEHGPAPAG